MKLSNVYFPHPILGVNRDDILPPLTSEDCSVTVNDDDIYKFKFTIKMNLYNEDIINLIHEKKASFVCEVDCASTLYRKSYFSETGNIDIEINRKDLANRVVFNCFVIAIKPIIDYANKNANEDYNGFMFDLQPGDVLVGYPDQRYELDLKYELLQRVSSFMVVRKALTPEEEKRTSFDLNRDIIQIILPTEMFNTLNSPIGKEYASIIHASLASNTLIYALCKLNDYYPTYKWAKAIVARISSDEKLTDFLNYQDNQEVHIHDEIAIATKILNDPFKRMFTKLTEFSNSSAQITEIL